MAEIFSIQTNFDILLILEPKECCSKVRLVGAHDDDFNIIYTKQHELVNDMQYYVDNKRKYAIWFDGISEWMIGSFSNIKEGKFTTGGLGNDEFVECPTDTNDWQEYTKLSWSLSNFFNNKREWKTNLNAKLSCY